MMNKKRKLEGLIETDKLLAKPNFKEIIEKTDREIAKGGVFTFDEVFQK